MYVAATMGPSIQVDINALRDMKLTDACYGLDLASPSKNQE